MKRFETYILCIALAFFTWQSVPAAPMYTPNSAGAIMNTSAWTGNITPAFSAEAAYVDPASGTLPTPVYKPGIHKAPPIEDGTGGLDIEHPLTDANGFLLLLAGLFMAFKLFRRDISSSSEV